MTSSPSQSQEPLDRTSRPRTKGKLVPGTAEQKTYSLCATYSQKTREDWFMHIKFPLPNLPICYVTSTSPGKECVKGKRGCRRVALAELFRVEECTSDAASWDVRGECGLFHLPFLANVVREALDFCSTTNESFSALPPTSWGQRSRKRDIHLAQPDQAGTVWPWQWFFDPWIRVKGVILESRLLWCLLDSPSFSAVAQKTATLANVSAGFCWLLWEVEPRPSPLAHP